MSLRPSMVAGIVMRFTAAGERIRAAAILEAAPQADDAFALVERREEGADFAIIALALEIRRERAASKPGATVPSTPICAAMIPLRAQPRWKARRKRACAWLGFLNTVRTERYREPLDLWAAAAGIPPAA